MSQFAFAALSPVDQRELVGRFLMEYAKWDFEKRNTQIFSVRFKGGMYGMDYKACAKLAVSFMHEDHEKARKFEILTKHMKGKGLDMFYFYTMGERLEDVLK